MTAGTTNTKPNLKAMPRPATMLEKYTPDQLHDAAHEMEAMGGHFASCIASAYFVADSHNKQLLLQTFGHLFERFIPKQERFDAEQAQGNWFPDLR